MHGWAGRTERFNQTRRANGTLVKPRENDMLDCLILGDSIAVGVSQALPECGVYAKNGIGSAAFTLPDKAGRVTVISLGSNDQQTDIATLLRLRRQITAEKVFWIVPFNRNQKVVEMAADLSHDGVIEIKQTSDGVHPTTSEYRRIAEEIRRN